MKTTILTLILLTVFSVVGLNAQITNTAAVNNAIVESNKVNAVIDTNAPSGKDYNKVDITLSGAGTSLFKNQAATFGLDVSVSIDPIKKLPNLWFGVSQSLYWQPEFAGSTDIDAAWYFHIYKAIYAGTGWSVGRVYDTTGDSSLNYWRTGPEVITQYYVSDDVFFFGGLNYAITEHKADQGLNYTFGIGWEF